MRIRLEDDAGLVLYDDHGEPWRVTLEAGELRVIAFVARDHEPVRVRYDGTARVEQDLLLDDVAGHFLDAHI